MNWSYIAGFFDGEGSLTHNGIGFRITVSQTNEEVLNEIRDFTGVGNVIKLRKREAHWKDAWLYYIASKKDVCTFLKKAVPHLVIKKRSAMTAIPCLEKQLVDMKNKKNLYKIRKVKAKNLRGQGLSYREIGKKLSIDWGYTRRLILDLV